MDEDAKRAATFEIGSRYLARKGLAAITDLQAQVDRARELLASGEVEPDLEGAPPVAPPYEWELTTAPLGAPKRIWLASVENFATGMGHSAHGFACLAHDKDEVRRLMALSLGRFLANGATIGEGREAKVPIAQALIPEMVPRNLEEIAGSSGEGPAVITFLASYHANYS